METGPRTHFLSPSSVRRPLPSVTLRQSSPPFRHSPSVVPQNPPPTVVQHRPEREFQEIYPDNANPRKLVSRIKKIQEELSTLEDQYKIGKLQFLILIFGFWVLKDLIDKARTTLVGNRNQLHQLQCIGVGRVRFGSAQRILSIIDLWKATFSRSRSIVTMTIFTCLLNG
ncbi:hypothetical protein D8674_012088 [Pyrus ussuriensis x Pyrus communis]|uniref:Protein FAM33A n=1 Tax=Pyrus ussuriensis x Pyrus communis TaxID=2448454 RepID=A0A5N5G5B1_9ROSA|nr:hypothetical protein D8674_012088 [Pyrus ussuriensis x Pyrus communis]